MAPFRLPTILLLASLLPSCILFQSRESRAIESIISEDRELYREAQEAIEDGATEEEALSTLVQRMRQIDLRGAPPDFRQAYVNHIHAWDGVVRQVRERNEGILSALFIGLLGLFVGQPGIAVQAFTSRLSEQGINMDSVQSTWQKLELIAAKHGANIGD